MVISRLLESGHLLWLWRGTGKSEYWKLGSLKKIIYSNIKYRRWLLAVPTYKAVSNVIIKLFSEWADVM